LTGEKKSKPDKDAQKIRIASEAEKFNKLTDSKIVTGKD